MIRRHIMDGSGHQRTIVSPIFAMRSPIATTECPQSTNLGRNSFDSLHSSDHAPPYCPVVGAYPSPYRASTAAAFADINRALDVRSLRSSVYATLEAKQAPPKAKPSPRPSLKTLSLSTRRANSNTPANQSDRPCHLASMRTHSLPNRPGGAMSSESESDGDGDATYTLRASHTSCAIPGGKVKVAEGRTKFPLTELGENGHPGRKDAHKSIRSRVDSVVTSRNGKKTLKRTRATTCLIM
ncbi:hypothetical protein B0J17DRAFT_4215 [Rhizoctonia solani]|nr:hypothetical protein B0J17DRAFT_4215 [Rhizoctonia solani]